MWKKRKTKASDTSIKMSMELCQSNPFSRIKMKQCHPTSHFGISIFSPVNVHLLIFLQGFLLLDFNHFLRNFKINKTGSITKWTLASFWKLIFINIAEHALNYHSPSYKLVQTIAISQLLSLNVYICCASGENLSYSVEVFLFCIPVI